jgi:hypothetical protein
VLKKIHVELLEVGTPVASNTYRDPEEETPSGGG